MNYTLDSQKSQFTVQAFAAGMLSGFAHNPTFAIRDLQGEMQLNPDVIEQSSLIVTARAASLELTDAVKEQDRREITKTLQEDVLESAKYPEITFRGTGFVATRIAENWFRLQIDGNLLLRSRSKPQRIDAQLRLLDGGAQLTGEFAVSQVAYGIKPVSALGGMIKLKDELKFKFDFPWKITEQPPA